jgi:hypothetical protein
MSRSPAIAAASISVVSKRSPAECLELVAKVHGCDVSPALWREVMDIAFGSLAKPVA